MHVDDIEQLRDRGLYKAVETIVIDEVSMVRADLMDAIDRFMRLNGPNESKPFGGILKWPRKFGHEKRRN